MVEWLENHHEWVFILALLWITVNLFWTIMSKRAKKKKKLISHDTTSIGDITRTDTGYEKPAGYGGGSGGGAGSTRGFVPASPANSAPAGDFNNITATDIVSVEGLTNFTAESSSQTLVESIATITPEADTIMEVVEIAVETTVEAVTDTAIEVAGEIVEGILKG